MKRLACVARFVVGMFMLAVVLLLLAYVGRTSVLLLGLSSLVALSVLKRTRPLWIAPMWWGVLPLGVVLASIPLDVKFSHDFPTGVWVRPAVWGLLAEPVPRDVHGVQEFWWSGSCIVYGNEPEKVLVIGLGGDGDVMAEEYRYSAPDIEVKDQIRDAMLAYETHFAEHDTYAGLDLSQSEWFEAVDCVTLEHEGNEDFYVIRGSHCNSPHVFEVTLEYEHPEAGKVRRVE